MVISFGCPLCQSAPKPEGETVMAPVPTALETAVMRKVACRLMPLFGLGYLINVLDRFNISFAALTMNKALGLSATAYGLGAGAFFWSYVLFQIPANIALTRFGSRRWITTIMIAWGLCSAGAALITDGTTFVIARFLLGIAEAGFLPGAAFFLTCWFPARHRGRAMGILYATGATAGIIGGPIAAQLLTLNGALGIAGWQWIFLAEGLPALALAAFAPFLLRDRPSQAAWLTPDERTWLQDTLHKEQTAAQGGHLPIMRAILSTPVMLLMFIHFGLGCGVYGKAYFLPLMIKSLGYSNEAVGYITMIPAIVGVIGMLIFSRRSDRTGERVWHLAVPCFLGGTGLLLAGAFISINPWLCIAAFSLSSFGISGALPVFWNLPTAFLGASAAASGLAAINAIGNISGYAAPQTVGLLRDATGGYEIAMVVVGLVVLTAGIAVPLAARAAEARRAVRLEAV
jgi:MFS transporter, ACS family, tartrate transporter